MATKYCKLPHGGFGAITTATDFNPGATVDVTTKDGAVHARVLGERLYTYEGRSVWMLEDTKDRGQRAA